MILLFASLMLATPGVSGTAAVAEGADAVAVSAAPSVAGAAASTEGADTQPPPAGLRSVPRRRRSRVPTPWPPQPLQRWPPLLPSPRVPMLQRPLARLKSAPRPPRSRVPTRCGRLSRSKGRRRRCRGHRGCRHRCWSPPADPQVAGATAAMVEGADTAAAAGGSQVGAAATAVDGADVAAGAGVPQVGATAAAPEAADSASAAAVQPIAGFGGAAVVDESSAAGQVQLEASGLAASSDIDGGLGTTAITANGNSAEAAMVPPVRPPWSSRLRRWRGDNHRHLGGERENSNCGRRLGPGRRQRRWRRFRHHTDAGAGEPRGRAR
jgi:hypothetical protein